jgi:hypothetical protein
MPSLRVVAREGLSGDASRALELAVAAHVREHPDCLVLSGVAIPGALVSLGRFHLAPHGDPDGRVAVQRRTGGGRVVPLGDGFVVVALAMPHRSALVGDDPFALRPEQALNRCVRGALAGLRALGADAYYPGRDRITLDRRMLGIVSLHGAPDGLTVFELVLSVTGDWQPLGERLAAVDRDHVLTVEIALEHGGRLAEAIAPPSLDALVHGLAAAYADEFGLTPSPLILPTSESAGLAAAWVDARRRRPELDRHAIEWTQLGVLEVYLRLERGVIGDILLAGDFIADAASIAELERRLCGRELSAAAVRDALDRALADPRAFLLGVEPLQALVETVLRAGRSG